MQPNSKEEIEINVSELFYVLLHKVWIIILAGCICAVGFGIVSKMVMNPIYTSSTKIYVINRQDDTKTTYSDLQTGSELTMDYKVLVKSRLVTEQVIKNLGLNMTSDALVSNLSVSIPTDTRILEIKVNNTDPLLAKNIADEIAKVSAAQMVSVMEMEKVNVFEPGNLPTSPSSPNVKQNAMIGGMLGAVTAAIIIILISIMNDSVKSIEDVENLVGLTTLGSIPIEIKEKSRKNKKAEKKSKKSEKKLSKKKKNKISINQEGNSENTTNGATKSGLDFKVNEAYKTLRTNIQFCGKEIKTICITSCMPNEGKTVVSFRLASSIAENGKKVLFIDADLRKSVIVGRLRIDKGIYGLTQYLSGMNTLEEVVNKTKVDNLDIIFAGPIAPNPSELLGSETFKNLIQSQRELYDYIIVDTPPLGIVIDSVNAAKCCDGTIMVIESNNVSYKFVQRVVHQLEMGKCKVLGAVLNKIDTSAKSYSKYYGHNKHHYYYE